MIEPKTPYDVELHSRDIEGLTSASALAAFFARLHYPTEDRVETDPANLDITAEKIRSQIQRIELLADLRPDFQVYLFEVTSVTIALRKYLTRKFRDRAGNFLLVLTSDYEQIDFVLVDLAADEAGESSSLGNVVTKARPWFHTVNRRKPKDTDLRVLRRFTWTETDGYAQHEKLRAAFDLAKWSEQDFNNRALFSDHYLLTRLPDEVADWREGPSAAYRQLHGLYRNARLRLGGKAVDALRGELLNPALEVLGFQLGEPIGDLLGRPLCASGSGGEPIAWCLDLPWDRSLDAKDPIRDPSTPEVNPSLAVVDLLEREEAGVPWIIVTNGRLWRLYGRQAHSRATNYYEIDVEEAVSARSERAAAPQEPFRYFWFLFREQAFEPKSFKREGKQVVEPFLTKLWVESGEYANKLGDQLKEKVFEEVFETLASGFLAAHGSPASLSQAELNEAFEGTLTFLYRLLFLLYAEARDLLPVRDVRGYYEVSLTRIRKEVADHAGKAESQAAEKLAEVYGDNEKKGLYQRLLRLFEIVDRGDPKRNVPTYNGGLFLTKPAAEDSRPEARTARFLESHSLADLPLARALDLLARSEEEKTSRLEPVDYKSLGVRQLGSIYEGLLEFRLRVASEPMAIVKGKKAAEVIPLAEAREKNRKILRQGRGATAPEKIFEPGAIYLENDKRERRATGSYYTPDFVVEYIVRKTVGPILKEKLEALRPRLREAERWHYQRVKDARPKGENPAKYVAGPCVEERWKGLIDDSFDLKILDPAMGSGHFLVEAVDFVTDEMVAFLAGFSWNPIIAHLEYLRTTILEEMDRQDIAIDADRLTDTHLLKRHVLKRCIFGVDLNPMAVELAKVSLWLDCFTLGAPLSFLDHHLRRGNSLLGVTVEEARKVIERQLSLLGTRFAGLQLATLSMIEVSRMPDVTSSQVADSRRAFNNATTELTPYLRLLHFYLAHVVRVTAKKKPVDSPSVLLELIRAPETETLFSDQALADALTRLSQKDQQVVQALLGEAEERGFFHWQLEFPEVFFSNQSGAQFELDPNGGFDAVVGNPPWVRQEALKKLKATLKEIYAEAYSPLADIYVFFIARGVRVLRPTGRLGMILQNKWLKASYGKALRKHLSTVVTPLEVIDFGHAPLFDADTFPCTLLLYRNPPQEASVVHYFKVEDLNRNEFLGLDLEDYGKSRRGPVLLQRLRPEGWELLPKPQGDLMEKVREAGPTLKEYLGTEPQRGVLTGYIDAFLIDQGTKDLLVDADPASHYVFKPYLRGQDIQRWESKWAGQWMICLTSSQNQEWPWTVAKTEDEAEEMFARTFPALYRWMKPREERLRKRQDRGRYWWELRACSYYSIFDQPKIVYKEILYHSWFAWDDTGLYLNNKCYALAGADMWLLAVLNSSLVWWFLRNSKVGMKDDAFAMHADQVRTLPLPREPSPGICAEIAERVQSIREDQSRINRAPHRPELRLAALRKELRLHLQVFSLYGLTDREKEIVRGAKVPRDPLRLCEMNIAKLERAGQSK